MSVRTEATMEERRLVLILTSLPGSTRSLEAVPALEVARFLDGYYARCVDIIARRGGRTVKVMGDSCLAAFEEERCVDAVDCAAAIAEALMPDAGRFYTGVASNIHLAAVGAGELGPGALRRYDVVGAGVNHLFRMGGANGIRISEAVYQQLPDGRRNAWTKHEPTATYSLES